jgi:3-dehydroquinate synthase
LFLVGFMGSGKTAVGQELAQHLGRRFVDTDNLIITKAGKPIPRIFEDDGEERFRTIEAECVAEAAAQSETVIALGGGALIRPENRAVLRETGVSCYLRAAPEILFERVRDDPNRPLLSGLSDEAKLDSIRRMLAEREPTYAASDLVFDTKALTSPQSAAEALECALASPLERKIRVPLGERSYDVIVGAGIADRFGEACASLGLGRQTVLLASPSVVASLVPKLARSLRGTGFAVQTLAIPDGEEQKTFAALEPIYDMLVSGRYDRDCTLVAVGGGVIGDTVGFAAATFLRGVQLIQVPTTVLAQVDASIGGKTGVNHPEAKNMIGAFYQPRLVFTDVDALITLPASQMCSGAVEMVKHAMIADAGLLSLLETHLDAFGARRLPPARLVDLIARNCSIKASVVAADEREGERRQILNYGHTIGHALEAATSYSRFTHGEAVALGMVANGAIALAKGLLAAEHVERQNALLARLGPFPAFDDVAGEALWETMHSDKKVRAGQLTFVLAEAVGRVQIVRDVSREEALRGIEAARTWMQKGAV